MKSALRIPFVIALALGAVGCGSAPAVLPPVSARAANNIAGALPADHVRTPSVLRAIPILYPPPPPPPPTEAP